MFRERGDIVRVIVLVALLAGGVYFLSYLRRLGSEIAPPVTTPTPPPVALTPSPSFLISGPGGCRGIEECVAYCTRNPRECFPEGTVEPELSPSPVQSPRPPSPSPSSFPWPPPSTPASPAPTTQRPSPTTTSSPETLPEGMTQEEADAAAHVFQALDYNAPLDEAGPGGCATVSVCRQYCAVRKDECWNFFVGNSFRGR